MKYAEITVRFPIPDDATKDQFGQTLVDVWQDAAMPEKVKQYVTETLEDEQNGIVGYGSLQVKSVTVEDGPLFDYEQLPEGYFNTAS